MIPQLGIDLLKYIELKTRFFTKHGYRRGDYTPLIPVYTVVKTDERRVPTACHLRPMRVSLNQADCIALIEIAREFNVVPLLRAKAIRLNDEVKFVYAGVPESFEEAITLLEDLPFPIEVGVLCNVYEPPVKELEGNAFAQFFFTGTIATTETKYPTLLVLSSIPGELWNNLVSVISKHVLDAREWGEAKPWRDTRAWKSIERRVHERLSRIMGETITFFVVSRDPPLALYPVFWG